MLYHTLNEEVASRLPNRFLKQALLFFFQKRHLSKGEEEEKGRGRELAEAEDEAAAASVDEGSSKECAQGYNHTRCLQN